ncbi:MAG: hypothetical protein HOO86_02350 [Bacteroidales bacterium]|nr:hypothetical protein [Bacteroidales bacterium]
MNTIGFYMDEHRKSADFVSFKACFDDLQRTNINTKYPPLSRIANR